MVTEEMRLAIDVLEFLAVGLVGVYAHLQGRNRVTEDKLNSTHAEALSKIAHTDARTSAIEAQLSKLPSHQDIQHLHTRLGGLHGDIQQVNGRLEGIGRAVDLINQHLLSQGQ